LMPNRLFGIRLLCPVPGTVPAIRYGQTALSPPE
jgi:hypothetical protein